MVQWLHDNVMLFGAILTIVVTAIGLVLVFIGVIV